MSTLRSQGLISQLAEHEIEDYCAHLLRLDRNAQTCRFGGQLSQTALAKRADLALREATCVLAARVDGHIRAAVELWELPGLDTSCELALSVEGGICDLELALIDGALRAAREHGVSRLIYMAGPSEKLPDLPDGSGASPWRPSDPDAWFCDLTIALVPIGNIAYPGAHVQLFERSSPEPGPFELLASGPLGREERA